MSRGISAIVVIRQALGGDGFVYEILVSKCGSESMPLREDTASEVTIIAAVLDWLALFETAIWKA
jgi:hypothetical protein